jgi:hypothetical protein
MKKYFIGLIQSILLFLAVIWNYLLVDIMVNKLRLNDFGKFYYSVKFFLAGGNIYGQSPATLIPITKNNSKHFWNVNPPHFLFPFLPFSFLSEKIALSFWFMVNFLCLFLSFFIIFRKTKLILHPQHKLWFIIGVLFFSAFGMVVITGQISFLLFLIVTLAWSQIHKNHWEKAGLLLGIAMSLKLQLLLFIPYLIIRRKITSLLICLFIFLFSFLMGFLVFGIQAHLDWFATLKSINWEWAAMNASVLGILKRGLSETPQFSPIYLAPHLVNPLFLIFSTMFFLITILIIFKNRALESIDLDFSIILLCSLLISPLGWQYYLWLAIGPLLALIIRLFSDGYFISIKNKQKFFLKFSLILSIPGLFYPIPAILLFEPHRYITLTIGSIYLWTDFFLWIFCVYYCLLLQKESLTISLNEANRL